jgi:molybdate transport system substrate-binding protein
MESRMTRANLCGLAFAVLWTTQSVAAEIRVLSAGAVEPGLHKVVEQFKRATAHTVTIQFNTAPQIAQRMQEGYVADLVIAPQAGLKQQLDAGRVVADGQVVLGKVGVGVVVRSDAVSPSIGTTEELKAAVLDADKVAYNTATTGLYLERVLERLGIAEQVKAKAVRPATGEAVMLHIVSGTGKQIGFGAMTEIGLFVTKGLKLVGPLPPEVQNHTTYAGALTTNAPEREAAKALLAFFATREAKQALNAAGIE